MTPHIKYKPSEKEENDTFWAIMAVGMLGIGSCVGIIYFLKWVNELLK